MTMIPPKIKGVKRREITKGNKSPSPDLPGSNAVIPKGKGKNKGQFLGNWDFVR